MNSKSLAILLTIFGILFTLAQCGRLSLRNQDDSDDDNDSNDNGGGGDDDDDSDANNAALREEKQAVRSLLEEQDQEDASQFLDQSRRLFSDQKSHMKEAKKKYEEKCERLLHPRYCPDLATWPAWNQAFNSASGKK